MENKRRSKLAKWSADFLARVWHIRYYLIIGIGYSALFCWLWFGASSDDARAAMTNSEEPAWAAPSSKALFGKTESGMDLFQLSRAGMANSVGFAVISVIGGVLFSFAIATAIAMGTRQGRFYSLKQLSLNSIMIPAFVSVLIVAAGTGGNLILTMIAVALVISVALLGVIADWCEDAESGGDVMGGLTLGMSRFSLVWKRSLPVVAKKCFTLVAGLIPAVVGLEMALSFLGFSGGRNSCGMIVALGRNHLLEAPWLSIYPGILATVVLVVLSALAWCVARLTKVTIFPRIF